MRRSFLCFVLLCVVLTVAACDMLAPKAYEPVSLSIRFQSENQGLAKAAVVQGVWAVVVDYNAWTSFYDTQEPTNEEWHHVVFPADSVWSLFHHEYDYNLLEYLPDSSSVFDLALDTREGWQGYLLSQGLSIISDQRLTLREDNTAAGTILGVPGDNWLILGIEQEEDRVTHYLSRVLYELAGDTVLTVSEADFVSIPHRPEIIP